jgi:hypothetical protein
MHLKGMFYLIFDLIVVVFSIYVFIKNGAKGLSKIFFIFALVILAAVIELVLDGWTASLKIWIIVTVIFLFCVTMFLFLRKTPRFVKKSTDLSHKSVLGEKRNKKRIRKKKNCTSDAVGVPITPLALSPNFTPDPDGPSFRSGDPNPPAPLPDPSSTSNNNQSQNSNLKSK